MISFLKLQMLLRNIYRNIITDDKFIQRRMFPFSNGSLFPHFPYCLNYEMLNQSFYSLDMNTYNNQILSRQQQIYFHNIQTIDPNHILPKATDSMSQQVSKDIGNKKRKIKRLKSIAIDHELKNFSKDLQSLTLSFKYFDPSGAPHLCTLRNKFQLQADLEQQLVRLQGRGQSGQNYSKKIDKAALKLQILLGQLDESDYPFLICKKRRYYRNLKKRYSVAYFEQRSSFIQSRLPIPAQLHPQYKSKSKNKSEESQDQADIRKYFDQGAQLNLISENFHYPINRQVNERIENQMMLSRSDSYAKFEVKK